MTYKDPEERRAYYRQYYQTHKEQFLKANETWKAKGTNRAKLNKSRRNKVQEHRLTVLTHYSNGTPICKCCKETEIQFLTLDHINGGGNKERKHNGNHQIKWRQIIANDYPPIYQVLCMNCNWGRRLDGICPHEKKTSPQDT